MVPNPSHVVGLLRAIGRSRQRAAIDEAKPHDFPRAGKVWNEKLNRRVIDHTFSAWVWEVKRRLKNLRSGSRTLSLAGPTWRWRRFHPLGGIDLGDLADTRVSSRFRTTQQRRRPISMSRFATRGA